MLKVLLSSLLIFAVTPGYADDDYNYDDSDTTEESVDYNEPEESDDYEAEEQAKAAAAAEAAKKLKAKKVSKKKAPVRKKATN